ncbi:MAG: hypothetical protein V4481_03525 [Patescibacteria group bacterium]
MKNYEISAWASVIVVVLGTAWYHKLLWQRKVQTIAATWIVATAAMLLNAVTYWTTPNGSVAGFALPCVSMLTIGSILWAVLTYSRIDGVRTNFNPFQKKCLVASVAILITWIVIVTWGGTGKVSFVLTQVLMIISYTMLIKKHWKADVNSESLILWWSVGLSSVVAMYTAYHKDVGIPWYDSTSWMYAIRSSGMCLILLPVLHRAARREERKKNLAYDAHKSLAISL